MGDKHPGPGFDRILKTFPPLVRDSLQTIPEAGGMLAAEHCLAVMDALKMSAEDLMQALLPAAATFGVTAISGFRVGAVAKARICGSGRDAALFLGANIEFPAQALTQTIHAEQAAILSAWLREAKRIDSIAVTAAPCGCCRQFFNELNNGHNLEILLCRHPDGKTTRYRLSDLLPGAFGPRDLGLEAGLVSLPRKAGDLDLETPSDDPLALGALAAAEKSYAPYSGNLAGCVIETTAGRTYTGRYAENAAFNPSLSPLHTAIIRWTLNRPGKRERISRCVLVEKPTSVSQRALCTLLLQTIAPDVGLEYCRAQGVVVDNLSTV